MSENPRRTFLKRTAVVASALSLESCEPAGTHTASTPPELATNPILEAVARIVLPEASLGEAGMIRVLEGFRKWLEDLEPVAELDHAYIYTDEILYGPPDPEPMWTAQLEALDLEAERSHEASFVDLPREAQEALLRRQLPPDLPSRLPDPARAPHVALGLLAYFYQTSESNDLCYGRKIERTTCRGIESGTVVPPERT